MILNNILIFISKCTKLYYLYFKISNYSDNFIWNFIVKDKFLNLSKKSQKTKIVLKYSKTRN